MQLCSLFETPPATPDEVEVVKVEAIGGRVDRLLRNAGGNDDGQQQHGEIQNTRHLSRVLGWAAAFTSG